MVLLVGAVYAVVYYFLFSLIIKKFNLKTPGRDENEEETKLYTKADVQKSKEIASKSDSDISKLIVEGLGGKENIVSIDCCATRLRVTIKNPELISESKLKETGASGVIKKGEGVQVIYGPKVNIIKSNVEDYLDTI